MDEKMQASIMDIIIHAGECKSHAYQALDAVNKRNYEKADEEMKLANEALSNAHNGQTTLINKEANGEKVEMSVLLVHSQDHLMTAISEKSLIEQIIELRKVVNKIEDKVK